MAARHKRKDTIEKNCTHAISWVQRKVYRSISPGRVVCVEGHRIAGDTTGRALVLKPAISLKKRVLGGLP